VTYLTAEARQNLLDDFALAIEELALALAVLGAAYELLDELTADRLEEELFRGVQTAFGRAQRTHAAFAARYSLQGRTFEQPSAGLPSQGARAFLDRAGEAITEADTLLAELQDSMLPVEVGDPELRAGLAEIRTLVGELQGRAHQFVRTFGR
jgi:hypothetical protein